MKYDIVICGGGIAGLWLLNALVKKGFNVLLIEKNTIGGLQTLASQGMIHGGQKYLLQGEVTTQSRALAAVPGRWEKCFEGTGDIDLRGVKTLSRTQVMWSAGSLLSGIGLVAAAKLVNAKTRKLEREEYPEALSQKANAHGEVYELPERVIDTQSLVSVLAESVRARIKKGEVTDVKSEGSLVVSGVSIEAQMVIYVAGLGNEEALQMLGAPEGSSQRRPLRQVIVKPMEYPLFGHGVVNNPKPRVTVTSHTLATGGYAWYLGGAIAEDTASMSDAEALAYARKEMEDMFPRVDWSHKEWATWYGVRAEARDPLGALAAGPVVQEYGNVLVAWPTKLTFTPILADNVLALIEARHIAPRYTDAPPALPVPALGKQPFEDAVWT